MSRKQKLSEHGTPTALELAVSCKIYIYYKIHSCSVRIKHIIRLGKNTRILTYFIMSINVRNDYDKIVH